MLAVVACLAVAATIAFSARLDARPLDEVKASGYLRVFVYENFPPFSFTAEGGLTGVDVEIGRRLAQALGVEVKFFTREADENVDDDLRNNVWKGHYLGGGVADVMMHVPNDPELARRNDLTVLFGRYYTERMALAVDPAATEGAETLVVFTHHPLGVEVDTLADFYISSPSVLGGRIRANARRYRDITGAFEGLAGREVAGLLGPQSQVEYAASRAGRPIRIARPPMPGLAQPQWHVGLAVKHDSRDLGYALGDVVTELRSSGELARIFAKFGVTHYTDFID